jgi:hypothetical protein
MRVFISWSGERSRQVAELLKAWLRTVIQASKPWISTGIDRGALWAGEIGSALSETNVGILCITEENVNAPWLLFEAGALAKGLPQSRVIPLLVDMSASDLRMPLSQFNATGWDTDGLRQLVHTVNLATAEPLESAIVEASLAAHLQAFRESMQNIIDTTNSATPIVRRTDGDKIDEVLSLVHGLAGRMQKIERRPPTAFSREDILRAVLANGAGAAEASAVLTNLGFPSIGHAPVQSREAWPNNSGLLGGVMAGSAGSAKSDGSE